MNATALVGIAAVVELGAIIALAILLIVSRRQLKHARVQLERTRNLEAGRRRRRRGVAPFAIRTAFRTADSLISKGLGATVRNSVEDLAGWAQVERPDLARLTADGDVVIAFSDIAVLIQVADASLAWPMAAASRSMLSSIDSPRRSTSPSE